MVHNGELCLAASLALTCLQPWKHFRRLVPHSSQSPVFEKKRTLREAPQEERCQDMFMFCGLGLSWFWYRDSVYERHQGGNRSTPEFSAIRNNPNQECLFCCRGDGISEREFVLLPGRPQETKANREGRRVKVCQKGGKTPCFGDSWLPLPLRDLRPSLYLEISLSGPMSLIKGDEWKTGAGPAFLPRVFCCV